MVIDLCVTLRCNARCLNCIKFCNKEDVTGLNFSDSDMTMGQINTFVSHVKCRKVSLDHVCMTGGEPFLHPKAEEIWSKLEELKNEGFVESISINSNKIIDPPKELRKHVFNYSLPKDNSKSHNVAFLHPSEFGGVELTYRKCRHYRKKTVVLSYMGYSICCAADGYIKLFGMEDLLLNYLPEDLGGFPLKEMNKICKHCPFSNDKILPMEKDLGCPVSSIYTVEANKNKAGRRVTKRLTGQIESFYSYSDTE